jgi:glyoxylase-like metal-dependent hydrolase (beta-lactamase superfamily II)
MVQADDVDLILPGLFIWHAYDPKVKAELCATAFETKRGMYLVDPIPLVDDALDQITARNEVVGVFVTNENHTRASAEFARRCSVDVSMPGGRPAKIDDEVQIIEVDGAVRGEIAICVRQTLILGDALINFQPHGFDFLPAKYCEDPKRMRRSLGQLLALDFERILFAHGEPITTHARERLTRLLADSK